MRSRVIPGSFVTIERREPVRRLKSVDFPTLGRPAITMDGSLSFMSIESGRAYACAALEQRLRSSRRNRHDTLARAESNADSYAKRRRGPPLRQLQNRKSRPREIRPGRKLRAGCLRVSGRAGATTEK